MNIQPGFKIRHSDGSVDVATRVNINSSHPHEVVVTFVKEQPVPQVPKPRMRLRWRNIGELRFYCVEVRNVDRRTSYALTERRAWERALVLHAFPYTMDDKPVSGL